MRLLPRPPGLTSRFQTGAISIMAAAGMAALIASALLAVDVGSLFYTKRQLQNVADNAALSAVSDLANAGYVASEIAARNDFEVPGDHSNTLVTVTGRYDTTAPDGVYQGTFTPGGDPALQDAVRVTVTTQQPLFFMLGSREVTATATATRTAVAGLSIGSGLLNIDTSQSALLNAILGGLLHTSLNLDAMSYQGLATAHVNLLDLVKVEGHVGTVEELLALDLSLAEVLHLTAQALGQQDILYLDLENLANLEALGNLHLKLGDLIKLSLADGGSAASADINVLQLISMSAQVANGEHFLNVPITNVNIPGILSLDLALSLIEAPSIAIGPAGMGADGQWLTQAHTAQTRLKVDVKLLPVLSGLLSVHLPLYVELAKGEAWLSNIECRSPLEASTVTIGATSGVAGVYIGEVNEDAMTNRETAATVTPAKIVDLGALLTVTAKAAVELPGGSGELTFNGPFDDQNTQRISGLETAGLFSSLSNSLVLDTGGALADLVDVLLQLLLGVGLEDLLKILLNALTPVLELLDAVLAPVLSLLGLQLGYADVTNFYLNCGVPRLVR